MSDIRLEALGDRPFSFAPPVGKVAENHWVLRRAEWSEILVHNPAGAFEAWIPKAYLAGVSEDPGGAPVLNLVKEIFYEGGSVWPSPREHIQTAPPEAIAFEPAAAAPAPSPQALVRETISRAGDTETRAVRLVGIAIGAVLLITLLLFGWFKFANSRQNVTITARDQSYLELNREHDYHAVTRVLGSPADDRWQSNSAGLSFRALAYPDRGFVIVLMGSSHESATYIGAVDSNWRPLHWVSLHSGDSRSLLAGMQRF